MSEIKSEEKCKYEKRARFRNMYETNKGIENGQNERNLQTMKLE